MKTLKFDVMTNKGSAYCATLTYTYNDLFPLNIEELVKYVRDQRPTLRRKDFQIAFCDDDTLLYIKNKRK